MSNRVLAALRIVPYTELQSYLWTKNGMVLENMLNYTTTVKHRHRIVIHVQIDFCKGCGYIAVHPWDAASPVVLIVVAFCLVAVAARLSQP